MSHRVIQANLAVTFKGAHAPMATGVSTCIWYQQGALEDLVVRMKKRMTAMMTKAIPLVTKELKPKKQHLRKQ